MKLSFFQAAVASILLHGCTTWTLTKRLEKKLDGNYTRMLPAILNKPWRQLPTRHQLYGHLPPITKTIQVRRTRHAGHCWRSRDDQHEHTFSNFVRIWDVVQKTCQRRWTIGKSGERGSGISVLPARHDDDDINSKKVSKVVDRSRGDQKAPFSIATTPMCKGGRYSFTWIAPLYPWYVPYIAEC